MTIIDNLLPLGSVDIVAVLDAEGNQLLTGGPREADTFGFTFSTGRFLGGQLKAEPMRATIRRVSQGFQHPLENSRTLIDHRIRLPIEVSMTLILARDSTNQIVNELISLYDNGTQVSVKAKSGMVDNLYVAELPFDETPEKFDALDIEVVFREIQTPLFTSEFAPILEIDQDTIDLGEINATQVA